MALLALLIAAAGGGVAWVLSKPKPAAESLLPSSGALAPPAPAAKPVAPASAPADAGGDALSSLKKSALGLVGAAGALKGTASTAAAALGGTVGGVPLTAVAGTGAAFAAAGALGFAITGDAGGAVGGVGGLYTGLSAGNGGLVFAQGGNVGRELGGALDRLLGGDGKSASSAVYQATGFVVGMAISCYGLVAVPVIGWAAGAVLAICSAADDRRRLDYGQAGAEGDMRIAARETFDRAFAKAQFQARCRKGGRGFGDADISVPWVRAALEAQLPQLDALELAAVRHAAACTAAGFIREENDTKLRVYRKQKWGVTVTSEAEHLKWGSDRGVFVLDERAAKAIAFAFDLGGTPVERGQLLRNDQVESFGAAGKWLSNVNHYLSAMRERYGLSAAGNPLKHAEYWRDVVRAFDGQLDDDANLVSPTFGRVNRKASFDANSAVIER